MSDSSCSNCGYDFFNYNGGILFCAHCGAEHSLDVDVEYGDKYPNGFLLKIRAKIIDHRVS